MIPSAAGTSPSRGAAFKRWRAPAQAQTGQADGAGARTGAVGHGVEPQAGTGLPVGLIVSAAANKVSGAALGAPSTPHREIWRRVWRPARALMVARACVHAGGWW